MQVKALFAAKCFCGARNFCALLGTKLLQKAGFCALLGRRAFVQYACSFCAAFARAKNFWGSAFARLLRAQAFARFCALLPAFAGGNLLQGSAFARAFGALLRGYARICAFSCVSYGGACPALLCAASSSPRGAVYAALLRGFYVGLGSVYIFRGV